MRFRRARFAYIAHRVQTMRHVAGSHARRRGSRRAQLPGGLMPSRSGMVMSRATFAEPASGMAREAAITFAAISRR